MIATVKYQVATYSGEIKVNCSKHDDNDYIISKAKRVLTARAGGNLPFGYQSFKVIERS